MMRSEKSSVMPYSQPGAQASPLPAVFLPAGRHALRRMASMEASVSAMFSMLTRCYRFSVASGIIQPQAAEGEHQEKEQDRPASQGGKRTISPLLFLRCSQHPARACSRQPPSPSFPSASDPHRTVIFLLWQTPSFFCMSGSFCTMMLAPSGRSQHP